jgi:uncharacterized phage protein (TIGR02218 family)
VKATSPGLRALLATSEYVSADCWTITLNGGVVVRWTSADQALSANGNRFLLGPLLKRGAISERRGVEVSTLDCEITAIASRDLINGKPIIPFIKSRGFDGAVLKLERAFAPDWKEMLAIGATGTIHRFSGLFTSVPEIKGATARITASSWLVLLNAMMPRNQYQAACLHTVYDAGCTLNPASFSATGHVVGSAGATLTFGSNLTPTANDYALGRIVFTSGANNGISRTIRANDGAGNFTLIQPLPNGLAALDNFTIFPGCDLTTGRCSTRFANLANFKGTPFVPLPQTPLGSQSTTTTTRSGNSRERSRHESRHRGGSAVVGAHAVSRRRSDQRRRLRLRPAAVRRLWPARRRSHSGSAAGIFAAAHAPLRSKAMNSISTRSGASRARSNSPSSRPAISSSGNSAASSRIPRS